MIGEKGEFMADKITWTNERRKLKDLKPWSRNPRQIKTDQAKRLEESFEQFGQVETIAIGPDGEVYNGHQRLNVLLVRYGGDYEIECRVASRALTEKEREKLTIFLHKGAAGEWDFDTLANEFELTDLLNWGFEPGEFGILGDEKIEEKAETIRPREMFHVLISVPVDLAANIKGEIRLLEKKPGVQVEYGANG